MYISNCCILPSDWTAETLMERHKSRPYNPDIANTFFRVGYVETWGRGIQKICEACRNHGISEPEYEVLGGDITVKFTALQNSKASSNTPKHQNEVLVEVLEKRILAEIRKNNQIKQKEIAQVLGTSIASVQRVMKSMVEDGIIKRKGGKRFGHWIINE